jgi:hypothetical protein
VARLPGGKNPLSVEMALQDGWQAFCRAPWHFTLFSVLCAVVLMVLQGVVAAPVLPRGLLPAPALSLLRMLIGTLGFAVVQLWCTIGMMRGAWVASEGGRPGWDTFLRWDGRASGRLLLAQICLVALFAVILIAGIRLTTGVMDLPMANAGAAGLLIGLGVMLLVLYLGLGQIFLPWVALLQGPSPFATLGQGKQVVDPQWMRVLLLALAQVVLLFAGFQACLVGFFVAHPVVVCVSTAAYRQLCGTDDRTGALRAPPSHS